MWTLISSWGGSFDDESQGIEFPQFSRPSKPKQHEPFYCILDT